MRMNGVVIADPNWISPRPEAVIHSKVEHVFAGLKDRMGLFVRTIGLERATTKIGLANVAYNMRRLIWLDTRNAPV